MKYLITLVVVLLSFTAKSQYTPDTLINGKMPVTILVDPSETFPYKVLMFNKTAYVITYNQLRGISNAAAIDSTALETIQELEFADSLHVERIDNLEATNKKLQQNYEAAMLSYEAEKLKAENNQGLIDTKDALIATQRKEIRRQKFGKWAAIIGGGILVTLTYLSGR
ncbi:MAG: hypothetical protein P8J32_00285 [bacterium]|nr:hypothetical protein [bacterium]